MKFTMYMLLPLLLLAGCSNNSYKNDRKSYVKVYFNSTPQGALIICNNEQGYTPKIVSFKYTKQELDTGHGFFPSCQLKWASGATVNIKKKYINSNIHGLAYSVNNNGFQKGLSNIVKRPNVPGYATDALFVLKLKTLKATQDQARAARIQARAAEDQVQAIRYQNNRTINCTKHGNSISCN